MVYVAYARHSVASKVVEQCRVILGPIEPRLLMVFCGGKHEPTAILAAIRVAFGDDVPVVGGSAAGAIWREGFGYSGLELGIAAFVSDDILPRIAVTRDLDRDERQSGVVLGGKIVQLASDGALVLLFYDSVRSLQPLQLHPASAIVEGLQEGLQGRVVRVVGGGTLTDMNLSDSWVFDGTAVAKHAAVALVFPSTVGEETVILHGCRPVSTFMEITRIDGAEVFELDHEPALVVIERMLGLSLGGGTAQELSLIATLGEKQGDPYAPYDENNYVNRLILRTDRAAGSITLFEPDFALGTRVQIMSRDNTLMLDSVREGVVRMNRRLEGRAFFRSPPAPARDRGQ